MENTITKIIAQNLVMLIFLVLYASYIGYHYYREKKFGGRKLSEYDHNSGSKTLGKIMLTMGLVYTVLFVMQKQKSVETITAYVILLVFLAIVSFWSFRKIELYENGIAFGGKYIAYTEMAEIKKINNNAVQITLSKKRFGSIVFMKKIEREKDFVNSVKKRMKMAKKAPKSSTSKSE